MKQSTLQDVARVAGVSTATVSRTLSNPDVVSEAMRKKVSDAVASTGYRINRAARNLRTRRAHTVLVLMPDLVNPFFPKVLEGISKELSHAGYSMMIASTQQVLGNGEKLADYLDDARADGMIILDGGLSDTEVAGLASSAHSNCIVFACDWVEGEPFPTVRAANAEGIRAAVDHLIALGHRRIGHISGPDNNNLTRIRKGTFINTINEHILEARADWIINGEFSLEAGSEAARIWETLTDRPTAMVCASDEIAMGFVSELARLNISVPGDVSVTGFDDIDVAEHFIPALSTIRQDRNLIGETAAGFVLNRILKQDGPVQDRETETAMVIPVSLVARQSTATPPDMP